MSPYEYIAVFTPMLAAVGSGAKWLIGLDKKVDTQEIKLQAAEKLASTKIDDLHQLLETKFDAQGARLARIETALNGWLKYARAEDVHGR